MKARSMPAQNSLLPLDTHVLLPFAQAGDSHTGVAVGTYVYPVAAMSFGQALTLPAFKGMADSTMRQSSDGDAAR